jgi:hypothetical protein
VRDPALHAQAGIWTAIQKRRHSIPEISEGREHWLSRIRLVATARIACARKLTVSFDAAVASLIQIKQATRGRPVHALTCSSRSRQRSSVARLGGAPLGALLVLKPTPRSTQAAAFLQPPAHLRWALRSTGRLGRGDAPSDSHPNRAGRTSNNRDAVAAPAPREGHQSLRQ